MAGQGLAQAPDLSFTERTKTKSVRPKAKKPEVVATFADGSQKIFRGRYAWTLRQLVLAGAKGVTPIERPAPRWSHYVMTLRRAGITIETIDEKHGGPFAGTHGRYVLRDKVTLSDVPNDGGAS